MHARILLRGTVHARAFAVARTQNNLGKRQRCVIRFRIGLATPSMDVTRKQRFVLNRAVSGAVRYASRRASQAASSTRRPGTHATCSRRLESRASALGPIRDIARRGRTACKRYSVCKNYALAAASQMRIFPFYRATVGRGQRNNVRAAEDFFMERVRKLKRIGF